MTPFIRNRPTAFWLRWESEWRRKGQAMSAKRAFADWQHELDSLATWFHRTVRPSGETRRCAYCDVNIPGSSPETIDHFLPEKKCRDLGLYELALSWWNLFPSCSTCNTSEKGSRWSFLLLRPDVDPVDDYFDFDPDDGKLFPAPHIGRMERLRVRKTIRIFGLNAEHRSLARRNLIKDMRNAYRVGDVERLREMLAEGPYRFVVKKFISTRGVSL